MMEQSKSPNRNFHKRVANGTASLDDSRVVRPKEEEDFLEAMKPAMHDDIKKWDELNRMEEEEKSRRRSYRAAAAAREKRLTLLDKAIAMFGEDFEVFSRKVEDDTKRSNKALTSYKSNLAGNVRLTQRIKTLRSLLMRLKLFAAVIESKIHLYEDVYVIFLDDVARGMRLDSPKMVFNRYVTLGFMSEELFREQNEKENAINDLKEKNETYVNEANNHRLVFINQMLQLNERLEFLRNEPVMPRFHRGDPMETMDVFDALVYINFAFQNLTFAVDKIRSLFVRSPTDPLSKPKKKKKKFQQPPAAPVKLPVFDAVYVPSRSDRSDQSFASTRSLKSHISTIPSLPRIPENASGNALSRKVNATLRDRSSASATPRPRNQLPTITSSRREVF